MTWRDDIYLAPIAQRWPDIGLLTLDVFDTLLFRTCERPEDVFLEVGRRLAARDGLRPGVRPEEFAALRRLAQDSTYGSLGREPRLEDIYAALPPALCDRDAALRIELDVEGDLAAINPSVAALVDECRSVGIPVVLLSDMYLGVDRVRSLLQRAGFDVTTRVDDLIVSVDAGGYKMTGALYRQVLERYAHLSPGDVVHVGDNIHSDVRMAADAGLHAVHYDVVRYDPDATFAAERLVHGTLLPELTFARRLASAQHAAVADEDGAWFRTGATVAGPLATALVEWTLDVCVTDGVTLVAPLMREAHVLAPILERAAHARGLDLPIVPLHVSRHAVALAGVRDARTEIAPVLLEHRRGVPVRDIYALIGVPVPAPIAAHADEPLQRAHAIHVEGQSLRSWIAGHVACDDVRPAVERAILDARGRLASYLARVLGTHRRVATLDVGFYGNIQRALSVVVPDTHLVHLLGFAHGPAPTRVLEGLDLRAFAGGYGADPDLVRTIHRSAPVFEQVLQGAEGSTTGYASDDRGQVEPIVEANPLPAVDLAHKAIIQRGIAAFHDTWLELRRTRPHAVEAALTRRADWTRMTHRLVHVPTQAEASTLGRLHDDVNYGSTEVLPFCPPETQRHVAWTGADQVVRTGFALPVVWPQGVVAQVDPGAVFAPHAAAASQPYLAACLTLTRALRSRGTTTVIGYGTGDVAQAFVDAARLVGVDVVALVDSQPHLHGLRVRGVRVCSLDEAVALGHHVYAVLSFAHAAAIADTIRRRYGSEPTPALILDLDSHPTR